MVYSNGKKLDSFTGNLAKPSFQLKMAFFYTLQFDFKILTDLRFEKLTVSRKWATVLEFKFLDLEAVLCFFNHISKVRLVSPIHIASHCLHGFAYFTPFHWELCYLCLKLQMHLIYLIFMCFITINLSCLYFCNSF